MGSEIREAIRSESEEGIRTSKTSVGSLSHNIESLELWHGTHMSEETMKSKYAGPDNCTQPLGIQQKEFEHGLTGKLPVLMSEELIQDDPDIVEFWRYT